MPRYHFHLDDGRSFRDEEGADFDRPEAARAEALRYLAHALLDQAAGDWPEAGWRLTVTDETGREWLELQVWSDEQPRHDVPLPVSTERL